MSDVTAQDFDWSPLGSFWWASAAEKYRATVRQTRFACAKHRGASNTGAAREAGYSAQKNAIRQIAYRVYRSNVVQNLLAFAEKHQNGDAIITKPVDTGEARNVLSNLIRGSDPSIKIRALEALQRIDDRANAVPPHASENDGLTEYRFVRDFLQMPNGGCAIVFLWTGLHQQLSSLPLLLDVSAAVQRDRPELWASVVEECNPADRNRLSMHLADCEWQLETRKQIWGEIGIQASPGCPVLVH